MTAQQLYPVLAELAATFGDGHTLVYPPFGAFNAYGEGGGLTFPLAMRVEEHGALEVIGLIGDDILEVRPGDRILAVDGVPARELVARMERLVSGERPFRRAVLAQFFAPLIWALGLEAPFEVTYRSSVGGDVRLSTLHGVELDVLRGSEDLVDVHITGRRYDFRRLPGDIGYLNFRSMHDLQAFEGFLLHTFSDFDDRPIRGLIVDLRRNIGGSTDLGEALLGYLTEAPYRLADRMEWKVSHSYQEFQRALEPGGGAIVEPEYFEAAAGDVLSYPAEPIVPAGNPFRYRGPVCFLIGPQTFSSAVMLADAVKEQDLGTLVGDETVASPNGFGEVFPFRLPATRLFASVSTARFVRVSADPSDRRGVLPDLRVRAEGGEDDEVLAAALEWVDSLSADTASPGPSD